MKTAKEWIEKALLDAQYLPVPGGVIFVFTDFQAFIDQLCKEQRDNCANDKEARRTIIDETNSLIYIDVDSIRNAKQPEV